jgi:hypothetical protein
MVSMGAVPEQQFSTLIPWMVEKFGKKVYVIAADYNFGQISAEWNRKIMKDLGGEVVGEEFIPLGVSQFAQTIQNIQKAKPDWLLTINVGAAQDSFFEQAAAATSSSPATQFAFFDAEPAPRRFVLAQSARANCSFEVSDATVPCSDEGAKAASDGLFDIIFCRYSIFLYCSEDAARVALDAMMERLAPKGVLILGATDALPQGAITAHGLQRVKSLQHETREGTLRLEPNAWSRRMPVEGKELFAKDPRASPRAPSSDVDDGAREVAPACSSTSKGVGHLTTSDPAEALERSCTLREFRVNLGLSPRFALEEPPPPLLVSLSDRSIEILKASGNSSFYAKSLDSRAREYQRRRAERIDELRQEMRLAEEAELRRGLEEMHALQRAAMPKQLAEKLEARKPLVERLREEAALQEQRRRKMEEVTLAAIEARFGVSKSRGPRSKARRQRSQRDA